jgi:GntR family transcriptional regulator
VTINMRSDRPAYKQLADLLREQIRSGGLAPGTPVPSEATLMQTHGISRNTVRLAIQLLRSEGHVVTEHGRGTYVRERPPVRRLGPDRYRADVAPRGQETSFTRDHGIDWADYRLDKVFREVLASQRLAELLGVPVETPLLERHFTFSAAGEPQQISTSCYPLSLVAGTPVADPANEPWPGGNIAQLASLGVTVSRVEESITARMPMQDEAETLLMTEGVPVVAITRRMFAGDRPVEVADIVIPADRVALDYVLEL